MSTPIRVQRKRTKGFKLPENTVCVTRGTKFGNPFKSSDGFIIFPIDRNRFLPLYELLETDNSNEILVEWYRLFLYGHREFNGIELPEWPQFDPVELLLIKKLKGKNLACFCSLESQCHADILLEIANS